MDINREGRKREDIKRQGGKREDIKREGIKREARKMELGRESPYNCEGWKAGEGPRAIFTGTVLYPKNLLLLSRQPS